MNKARIPTRDKDAILQSLRAGVVPRRGLHLIQVGRKDEVKSLIQDLERMRDGGSAIRFVIGEFGSGKTFFLHLVRSIALQKKMVTVHADLTPDRRLYGTGGRARSLYADLMESLATRAKPDGRALASVVEKFVSGSLRQAREEERGPEAVIHDRLEHLAEMKGGYDFAHVIAAYWKGHDTGNDTLKNAAVRWLRAEYSTKTEARQALGVRTIIDDASFYDHLKLFARFVRLAGYTGLLVCFDELVNLYKMASTRSRNSNYEQILHILNDTLQGTAEGLGALFCGTPAFLTDTRKGLYSYEALRSRLGENPFAEGDLVDFSGPVIRLGNLLPEEIFVLLQNLRNVQAAGDEEEYLLPDEGLRAFMTHCSKRIGNAYFRTPRNTIREFVQLMAVLEQNPGADLTRLIGEIQVQEDTNPDLEPLEEEPNGEEGSAKDDELRSFKL